MNPLKVLILCPENTDTARRLGQWATHGWEQCRRLSVEISELRGARAVRAVVERELAMCDVLMYFGEGRPEALVGKENLIDAQNIEMAADRSIFAIACHTGRALADIAMERGVKNYLGFNDCLVVLTVCDSEFSAPIVRGMLRVMEGGSLRDAHDEIRVGFERLVDLHKCRRGNNHGLIWLAAHWNAGIITLKEEQKREQAGF